MALQLSLRGSVVIYQGEELGLTEATLSVEDLRDPFGITYWPEFRGRDGCRTPMPWVRAAAQAGFPSGVPWLPVADGHAALAVDAQEDDPAALMHAWRRFLAYRRAHPVLAHGGLRALDLPAPLVGFVRFDSAEAVVCLFNLSGETLAVPGFDAVLEPWGTAFQSEGKEGFFLKKRSKRLLLRCRDARR